MVINKTRKYLKKRFSSISRLRVTQSTCYPNPAKLVFHDHLVAMLGVEVREGAHMHAQAHAHTSTRMHKHTHAQVHTRTHYPPPDTHTHTNPAITLNVGD